MQKATVAELVDLQGKRDERQIPSERVGVSHLRCPIVVLDRSNRQQNVTATVSMSAYIVPKVATSDDPAAMMKLWTINNTRGVRSAGGGKPHGGTVAVGLLESVRNVLTGYTKDRAR